MSPRDQGLRYVNSSHKITVLEHASCGLCAIAELLVILVQCKYGQLSACSMPCCSVQLLSLAYVLCITSPGQKNKRNETKLLCPYLIVLGRCTARSLCAAERKCDFDCRMQTVGVYTSQRG